MDGTFSDAIHACAIWDVVIQRVPRHTIFLIPSEGWSMDVGVGGGMQDSAEVKTLTNFANGRHLGGDVSARVRTSHARGTNAYGSQ